MIYFIFFIVGQIQKNIMEITWLLIWLNISVATLNTKLQLLVLYKLKLHSFPTRRSSDLKEREKERGLIVEFKAIEI